MYLYRIRSPAPQARALLVDYLDEARLRLQMRGARRSHQLSVLRLMPKVVTRDVRVDGFMPSNSAAPLPRAVTTRD